MVNDGPGETLIMTNNTAISDRTSVDSNTWENDTALANDTEKWPKNKKNFTKQSDKTPDNTFIVAFHL